MLRIAICDNEKDSREGIAGLIAEYAARSQLQYDLDEFDTGAQLLEQYEEGTHFDILVLDVYIPGMLGTELARAIRKIDTVCAMIFLTSSREFALEAYEVEAVQYLIKPVARTLFLGAMEQACVRRASDRRNYLVVKSKEGNRRIALRDILYCEAQGNYQVIYLYEGPILRTRMASHQLFASVSGLSCFVRCGNSYIVNLAYVRNLSARQVEIVNDSVIPVPRGAYSELRAQYFDFYCSPSFR